MYISMGSSSTSRVGTVLDISPKATLAEIGETVGSVPVLCRVSRAGS